MRWKLRGGVYEGMISARRVWDLKDAQPILTSVTFKLEDRVFPQVPENRHMTEWFSGEQLTVKHFWEVANGNRGGQLTDQELQTTGLAEKQLQAKVVMEPFLVSGKKNMSVKIRVVVVPGPMEKLKEVADKWKVNVQDISKLPCLALKIGTAKYTVVPMGIDEKENEGANLSTLPMIEVRTGADNFHYPSRKDIAKEIQAFMKDWQTANLLKPQSKKVLELLYQAEAREEGIQAFMPQAAWPSLLSEDEDGEAISGKKGQLVIGIH